MESRRQKRPALDRDQSDPHSVSRGQKPRGKGHPGIAGQSLRRDSGERLLFGLSKDGLQKAKVPGPSAQRTQNIGGKIGGLRQGELLYRLQASAQTHAAAQTVLGETGS